MNDLMYLAHQNAETLMRSSLHGSGPEGDPRPPRPPRFARFRRRAYEARWGA